MYVYWLTLDVMWLKNLPISKLNPIKPNQTKLNQLNQLKPNI